jgi:hypothetical protein
MKRIYVAVALIALSLGVTGRADAQMGMSMFQKPAIAKFFNPVVGKGAQYETTRTGHKEGKATSLEMAVVGKESVNGKDGFWMQFVTTDEKGQPMVGKMLFTSDMQSQRMIMQMKGQPEWKCHSIQLLIVKTKWKRTWQTGTRSAQKVSPFQQEHSRVSTGRMTRMGQNSGPATRSLHLVW